MAPSFSVKHIGEIDGLRAVAVLAVLLYHVRVGPASGGFVGVDVFFVISGYLITGILLSDRGGGAQSLKRFYARRILRIAPALCVTLAFTALVFFALFPPVLSGELLASFVSAALSYSNLWFYFTVDYFGDNTTNPVLHMWSLAVEEQFYFFFPLLLLLIRKSSSPKYMPAILAGLFGLSLLASGIIAAESQAKAFYFPWLRAWELLAGSLLAVCRPGQVATRFKAPLSNLGLAAIVVACFLYDDKMVFPGYSALLPVLGAVAVIAGVGSDSIANHVLRVKFMRWTGWISYSLYLVHWPIICAASLLVSMYTNKVKAAVVIASFLFAWISWRFVETPFRGMAGRVPNRQVFTTFAAVSMCFLPFLFTLQFASAALWERFPKALEYSAFAATDISFFREGTCFLTPKFDDLKYFRAASCLKRNESRTGVLVIGDSHAANIVAALAAQHASVDVLQATAAGCKPTLDAAGPPYCSNLMKRIFQDWIPGPGHGVEYVVIAARWVAGDIEPLRRTIAYLRKLDKRVILYGPGPEYSVSVPLLLAYEQILGIDLGKRLLNQERRQLDAKFRSVFTDDVMYFSPFDSLCNPNACALVDNGAPIFFDRDHLTLSGAMRAVRGFPLT
jgi:peptidoglycan/LPS O-acetylase OafA/YrhL